MFVTPSQPRRSSGRLNEGILRNLHHRQKDVSFEDMKTRIILNILEYIQKILCNSRVKRTKVQISFGCVSRKIVSNGTDSV